MNSIRSRLLVSFAALVLLAAGLLTVVGAHAVRNRADAFALRSFAAAREQLRRSLALRYESFLAVSDLSFVVDVVRYAGKRDQDELGLAPPVPEGERLRQIHESVIDSSWDWGRTAGDGFVGLVDYQGRVVYTTAAPAAFGGNALGLSAVADAYDIKRRYQGSMVVRGGDPAMAASGLAAPAEAERLYLLFTRATVTQGRPGMVFVQGIRADQLLRDVALTEEGTLLSLVGPGGSAAGTVPGPVLQGALALPEGQAPARLSEGGARWLAGRFPVPSLGEVAPIATIVVARNLDVGLAEFSQAVLVLVVAGVGLLVLALALAHWLASHLSRPVEQLEVASRQVASGDLEVQVPVRSHDEVGRLAQAFNAMVEGLRDRERIKRTFKKYLAPDVVDYLLANPSAQKLGGERRRLTVLFSDLEGFTTIAEHRTPEEVVGVLNIWLSRVSARVASRGGTIDKYLGDAVMAFFGAPKPQEDHAARACLAALDHLAVLEELRPEWERGSMPALAVRVGVNAGEMIVGNIGGEDGQDYTVIGDAVNLASRLEGANKFYGTRILISETVWADARGAVEAREIDLLRVKGKAEAVRIYELLGPKGCLEDQPARQEALGHYARGLELYRERRFAEAASAFQETLRADPGDGPARALLERSRGHQAAPPGEAWDGVHELTSK